MLVSGTLTCHLKIKTAVKLISCQNSSVAKINWFGT